MSRKTQKQPKQQKQQRQQQQLPPPQQLDDSHEEATHWKDVLRTLLHYEDFVAMDLARRQEHLNRLPNKWAEKLPTSTYSKLEGMYHHSISSFFF
jgi:hypothetical protein